MGPLCAAAPEGSDRCDSALLPQITISSAATSERAAYLSLVSESNYEQSRAGGALNIILEDLPIGASYEQFDEKRRTYLSHQRMTFARQEARALLRQGLSEAQLQAWQSCMTADVPGVRIVLREDDIDGVSAKVHYVEAAGRTKRFRLTVRGGELEGGKRAKTFTLSHGGSIGFDVLRETPTTKIRITVNGRNMTDSSVSLSLPSEVVVDPWKDCDQIALLSAGAPATASSESQSAGAATDGDISPGNWNSKGFPPQWIEIDLSGPRRIRHVSLNPEQSPSGFTQNRVYGLRPDGTRLLLSEYNASTISGGIFTVIVDPRVGDDIRAIRVETISGPSWVSWREIEVYGCN